MLHKVSSKKSTSMSISPPRVKERVHIEFKESPPYLTPSRFNEERLPNWHWRTPLKSPQKTPVKTPIKSRNTSPALLTPPKIRVQVIITPPTPPPTPPSERKLIEIQIVSPKIELISLQSKTVTTE